MALIRMKEWKEGMGMWNRKKTIIIAGCSWNSAPGWQANCEHGDDVIIIDRIMMHTRRRLPTSAAL